jgi:hypothetical protein
MIKTFGTLRNAPVTEAMFYGRQGVFSDSKTKEESFSDHGITVYGRHASPAHHKKEDLFTPPQK